MQRICTGVVCFLMVLVFGISFVVAGKNAFIGGGGYAATKHALLGFSRCVMLEERKNGVRVLAICPGSIFRVGIDWLVLADTVW